MAKFKVLKSHTDPKSGKQLNPGDMIDIDDAAQARQRADRQEVEAVEESK